MKKVAGWNFAAMHRRRHGERRHHLCNGVGGVAAPAWLIAPDWRDLNRRREIEEGMKFAKMHKKLKTTKICNRGFKRHERRGNFLPSFSASYATQEQRQGDGSDLGAGNFFLFKRIMATRR